MSTAMTEISAALVKELRELSGAGMMDCKRALQETGGDVQKAFELLRQKGIASAAKRAWLASSFIRCGARILIANGLWSVVWRALYTRPIAPSPMSVSSAYLSSTTRPR